MVLGVKVKLVSKNVLTGSFVVLFMLSLLISSLLPAAAKAVTANPTPQAKVSLTFDDGYKTAYTNAAPTLAKYGLTGTSYVVTRCIDMTTAPNTCHADTDKPYMSWAQLTALQNTYGWEIGSHTVSHPYLASFDASDGQPNRLTPQQVTQELAQSKADLAAHGFNATAFASPYGDYTSATLAEIAKYYTSHRGFADTGYNTHPYSDYLIRNQQVQGSVSVATVKSYIDQAIANKNWLVLTFHDIKAQASRNNDNYEYSTANLDQIAAYVKAKQTAGAIQSSNISKTLVSSDTNMLTNGSFNSGISGGWTTDNTSAIAADSANHGSFPDYASSIRFQSNSSPAHLFSPHVSVNPSTTYILKNFLNVQNISSGQISFYMDEYDVNGNWISGQYKTQENSVFVENLNFTYKPSSSSVAQASLQVGIPANSGITAYLDNSQWFAASAEATPPPPPPVTKTNLVAGGTFESGLTNGWSTNDPTNIKIDSNNNGSPENPVNSVQLKSSSVNRHLFSPKVAVDSTKNYSLITYLNLKQISGNVVGFYMDEYDVNGNWISGQYKLSANTLGARDITYNYVPSSSNVKSASLQVIVTASSQTLAYIDNVRWYQN